MHRLLRLFMLWLVALALPLQGAAAMTAQAVGAGVGMSAGHAMQAPMSPSAEMSSHVMQHAMATADAGATPHCVHCPHHDAGKAGCGACCAPVAGETPALAVTPVAALSAPLPRPSSRIPAPVFLTGGLDRPPRSAVA